MRYQYCHHSFRSVLEIGFASRRLSYVVIHIYNNLFLQCASLAHLLPLITDPLPVSELKWGQSQDSCTVSTALLCHKFCF